MSRSSPDDQSAQVRLQEQVRHLVAVCGGLRAQLDLLRGVLAPAEDSLARGVRPDQVVDMLVRGAFTAAVQATDTIRGYEHAVRLLRGAVVGFLVEEQGMTYSSAAERLGISRTAVSRLHGALRGSDQSP